MRRILSAPLRLEFVNDIKSRFATPDVLWTTLETSANYAAGAGRLSRWSEAELLVPKDWGDEVYRNLSVEGYELAAKVRMWGHTAPALDRVNELKESILTLYHHERPHPVLLDTVNELEFLKSRKITALDASFFDDLSALLSKRRELRSNRWINWLKYGLAGFGILAAVRVLFSALRLSYAQLAVFGFMLLLCLAIYFFGTLGFGGDIIKKIGDRMAHYGEWSWRREDNFTAIVVMIILILIRLLPYFSPMQRYSPEQYIRFLGGGFPLFGVPIGALVSNTLYSFRMGWNMDEIIDVCRAYTYYPGKDAA
jgi:hypothetical protein